MQAVNLRKELQITNYPQIQLLGTCKEGYLLCISAILVNALLLRQIELVAKENKLSLIFEQGYWMLIGKSN
jgi:hypothetical protein